ncbi:MAG: hypothetical protein ACXQS5_05570 [Candidatus Methanospirareceae archaeon]
MEKYEEFAEKIVKVLRNKGCVVFCKAHGVLEKYTELIYRGRGLVLRDATSGKVLGFDWVGEVDYLCPEPPIPKDGEICDVRVISYENLPSFVEMLCEFLKKHPNANREKAVLRHVSAAFLEDFSHFAKKIGGAEKQRLKELLNELLNMGAISEKR